MIQAQAPAASAPNSIAQAIITVIDCARAKRVPCMTLAIEALSTPASVKAVPVTTAAGPSAAARYSWTIIIAPPPIAIPAPDRKSVGWGTSVSDRFDLGGLGINKKNKLLNE